jgi:hypothetical protein
MSEENRPGTARENLIDTNWQIDDQNRLLSRGLLVFRYSEVIRVEVGGRVPTKWEKLLPGGTFAEVIDADQIKELNNALHFRLAILEDPRAQQQLTQKAGR